MRRQSDHCIKTREAHVRTAVRYDAYRRNVYSRTVKRGVYIRVPDGPNHANS